MPVIPLATRSQHVDFAYDQVVRPHRSYRPSGGLPRGKPRTRHMWICLQLSGARGVDNRGVKGSILYNILLYTIILYTICYILYYMPYTILFTILLYTILYTILLYTICYILYYMPYTILFTILLHTIFYTI